MNQYNFDEAFEIFKTLCDEYGVEVVEGTGQILKDGKPFDIIKALKETNENHNRNFSLSRCGNIAVLPNPIHLVHCAE